MTVVYAANLGGRNALLADIFVEEGDGEWTLAEKVVPWNWSPDTFFAGLGDETFLMILKNGIGNAKELE